MRSMIFLIYVLTYVFSIPLTQIVLKYSEYVTESRINQAIDIIFVYGGYIWFSIVFLKAPPQIPQPNKRLSIAMIYLVNTVFVVISFWWFFGPSIFGRIDIFAGGYCADGDIAYNECKNWIKKFDVSAHYFMIISMSLLLWYRIKTTENGFLSPGHNNKATDLWLLSCWTLLGVWYFEYLITSLFFHTILEKLVGMLFGVTVPLIVYVVK